MHSLSTILVKNFLIITVFQEYYNEDIEMIYVDDFKRHCYPIFMSVIIDYKE